MENTGRGESRVQQMIMGAGKTMVVSPLLALILADGATLVTQVHTPHSEPVAKPEPKPKPTPLSYFFVGL